MNKFNYSFHSHTFRCGHASGDIEDYVMEAIHNNFKILGVSDHVFLPGISQPGMRGEFSLLENYLETFNSVQKTYKNFIELHLGFECEYIPIYMNYYRYLLESNKVEFLICGQHCSFDNDRNYIGYFNYSSLDNYEGIERYKSDVIEAMKSEIFFYIAHPDLFMYTVTKITPEIEKIVNEIVDASIKYDIPLEMNISGFGRLSIDAEHGTLGYPNEHFWDVAVKKGAKIIFGGDYHTPEAIRNEKFEMLFDKLIQKTNVKFVDEEVEYQRYLDRLKKLFKQSH